jgi:metal-responsive CopG/Arc/MetJ family transcriptional regulator
MFYTFGSLYDNEFMATDKNRYTISIDNEMFEQIEDFRFKNRFQTRSEATAELIRLGLEAVKAKEQEQDRQ